MRSLKSLFSVALLIALTGCSRADTASDSVDPGPVIGGFDVRNAIIPKSEIRSGGPRRDGIPSIDNPKFVSVEKADFLQSDDQVVSITIGSETRAYPLRILVWHEIVNDSVGGQPIAVTYCPLCGTAMIFSRKMGDQTVTFGVSGLLYQSDVLMYDRETESLWSQLAMKSVAGPLVNAALRWLPSEQMTFAEFKIRHPSGYVLTTDTGHSRNYNRRPYETYENSPGVMFPVPEHRTDLPRKAWVLGVIVNGVAKAYPLDGLAHSESMTDLVGGKEVHIILEADTGTATVTDSAGETIPAVRVYWFAWQAFYPRTELWRK